MQKITFRFKIKLIEVKEEYQYGTKRRLDSYTLTSVGNN
jgi:hypothetical protein